MSVIEDYRSNKWSSHRKNNLCIDRGCTYWLYTSCDKLLCFLVVLVGIHIQVTKSRKGLFVFLYNAL